MPALAALVLCVLSLFSAPVPAPGSPPTAASAPSPTAQQTAGDTVTALLIIDVQDFYFPGGAMPLVNPEAASLNAAKLLERFRAEGRPVIHVGHNAKRGMGFRDVVAPREGEKVFFKDEVSVFNGTDLLPYLKELKVQRLVIAGMQTHMCVEAAVRAASDLGFECILVENACATRDLKYGGRVVSAADVHAATLAALDRTYATVVDAETFLATH